MQIIYRTLILILTLTCGLVIGNWLVHLLEFYIELRPGRFFRFLLIGGYAIIVCTIIFIRDPVNLLAALAGNFLLLLVCQKKGILQAFSVVILFFPPIIGINFIQASIAGWITLAYVDEIEQYPLIFGLVHLILGFVKLAVWYLIYRLLKKRMQPIKDYMTKLSWLFVDLVGAASFLTMLVSVLFPPGSKYTYAISEQLTMAFVDKLAITLMIAVIASNLGIILLLNPLIENVRLKIERKSVRIREEYYHTLEEQQENIRKIRHEMNHHFQMLEAYLRDGKTDQAVCYLQRFEQSLGSGSGRQFCREPAVNAILNQYYTKLTGEGIDVHFHIAIEPHIGIEAMDLCTLFADSLDNAWEASMKAKDTARRKVILKARCEKEYFSYLLTNYKENEIRMINGRICSDKEADGSHGYGLENIRDIAKKYHGDLKVSYTEEEFFLFLYMRNS